MKKISSLFIALLFIFIAQSVQADYIPIDIPVLNATFTRDYLTNPPITLGGVTFNFANSSFFAFDDKIENTTWTSKGTTSENTTYYSMTMLVQPISSATTAYLLLNTNWGTTAGNAGMVTFFTNTPGDYLNVFLKGNDNIRDWNSSGNYTNDLTAANATANVFSVTPNSWGILKYDDGKLINPGSAGRIDMLTVDLATFLQDDEFLTSIVFTDYGSDEWATGATGGDRSGYASHLRIEGVTIKSIPEPATLLLLALGLCVLGFVRTRFSKV